MNSKIQANSYTYDLGLLIISHYLHVPITTRSACREKSIQTTHLYIDAQRPSIVFKN